MFPRFLSKRSLIIAGALVFSAAIVGSAATAEPARKLAHKPTDLISQEDIEKSPRGYRLLVPGVGEVNVVALKAPRAGKKCSVSKSALVKTIAAKPPTLDEPEWVQLTIYNWPDGSTFCFFPRGGGCYLMVKKTP